MSLEMHLAGHALGRDAGVLLLHSPADHRQICAHMVAQVQRELCLLTRDLDKAVFDQAPFLAALKDLALRSRYSRIHILVQDPAHPVREGHRLIELTRRLTSATEVRKPHKDFTDYPESFLLADQCGYIHRGLSTCYEGTADYHAPLLVQRLHSQFEAMWETAQADPELRRLYL
jgi:hypothetical protein